MKFIKWRAVALLTALCLVILFSRCNEKTADKNSGPVVEKPKDTAVSESNERVTIKKNCCEGYTGKVTDPRAEKLVNKCHFIPADLIQEWTARYQKYKKNDPREKLPGIGELLGDSSSFNSCIIRKIIGNEKCIGLRVVYGMSEDKKIHVIFVGIQPDYSSLYIKEEDACCNIDAKKSLAPPPPIGKIGGAEYGQMP